MDDKNTFVMPPGGRNPGRGSESPGACAHGISESQFPYEDSCFRKGAAELGDVYETLCPHCAIWTSLPEGAALKVTRIFECADCGYGKRISEEGK